MNDNAEVIISTLKVKENIKKYYWVCIVALVISVIVAAIITLTGYKTDESSDILSSTTEQYYQADAMIQVKANESGKKIIIKENNDTSEAEIYSDTNYNIVANYATVGLSNEIRDNVNAELVRKDYDKLCGTDGINVIANGGNIVTIAITGLDNSKRTEFIANVYAKSILEKGNELFADDLESSRIISEAESYTVTKNSNGSFTKTYSVSLDKGIEESEDSQAHLTINSFFNKTNIIIITAGLLAGFGIILIMVIRDKTLRTRDDVDNMFNMEYLGEIGTSAIENQLTISAIESRCVNDNISSVIVTAAAENVSLDMLIGFASGMGNEISNKAMPGIEVDAETVKELNRVDGVIFVIASGRDDADIVNKALDRIKVVKANLLGYVILK